MKKSYYSELGHKVRVARKKQDPKLSIHDLAHKAGVNYGTIQALETGKTREVKLDTILRVAAALGIPPAGLVDEEVNIEALKAIISIQNAAKKIEK